MTTPLISKAIPLPQITIAAASVIMTYTLVGTFSSPVEVLYIMSTLNKPVQLSFDGINDHIAIAEGDAVPVFLPLDFKTNRMSLPNPSILIKEIGSAPTTGNLYISAFTAYLP